MEAPAGELILEMKRVLPASTRVVFCVEFEARVGAPYRIEMQPPYGDTEVSHTQGPFRTEARRALHRDGWTDSFDKLERLVAAEA